MVAAFIRLIKIIEIKKGQLVREVKLSFSIGCYFAAEAAILVKERGLVAKYHFDDGVRRRRNLLFHQLLRFLSPAFGFI